MHFFKDYVQWKSSKGVQWRDLNPPPRVEGELSTGYFLHDLHTVLTADGKAVYLPTYRSIYSRPNHNDGITAYSIVGDKLVETPFFKTKNMELKTSHHPA